MHLPNCVPEEFSLPISPSEVSLRIFHKEQKWKVVHVERPPPHQLHQWWMAVPHQISYQVVFFFGWVASGQLPLLFERKVRWMVCGYIPLDVLYFVSGWPNLALKQRAVAAHHAQPSTSVPYEKSERKILKDPT